MNINEFKSRIGGSLASPANFRVMISGAVVDSDSSRHLALLCNQAQMPGRYFQTADRITHGPVAKIASASIYDEMVLSFYCQEGLGVYELFTDWQSYIQDNASTNEFSYFDDYVSDITIEQLDSSGKVSYAVTLIDAFPRMVSPMQLDWSSKDSFHNLQVSMVYRYWRKEDLSSGPFSKFLNVSSLFPNFDVQGALQKTGVAIFDNVGGKILSKVGQNIRFSKNVKKSMSGEQQGDVGSPGDNANINNGRR
jgi:hypothetical protein